MDEFIYNLKLSNTMKPNSIKEIHYEIITSLVKGIMFILPAIYALYLLFKQPPSSESVEDLQNRIIEEKKKANYISIINGIIFFIIAIRLLYFYTPTNSELSLALLIKYLNKKNIITPEFYQILKNFKPHNIESHI